MSSDTLLQSSRLSEIIGPYKALFVDVYGVLHDGVAAFPGAVTALNHVRSLGTPIVIVTNSAERTEAVAEKLVKCGIGPECYDHIISSGELAYRHIDTLNRSSAHRPRLLVTRDGPSPRWTSSLPNITTDTADEADFILVAGLAYHTEDEALASNIDTLLRIGLSRALPMIVADTDETYPYHGKIRIGPGWVARRYERLGGETIEFGKPFAPIGEAALRLAGNPEPHSVLMIGDNLKTDIAFAHRMGFSSLLVHDHGVHRDLSRRGIAETAASLGIYPSFVTASLAI